MELELKVKDTFYISHGLARVIIRDSVVAKKFLESWKQKVYPQTPNAILVVSSHWDTVVPTVNVVHDHNQTLYDFPGLQYPQSIYNLSFCQALYELKYPAPGAPHLAKRVKELLNANGFKHVEEARERGLDHGAWNPLMLMYPEGDIPVCQLSIQSEQDASHHYNMGRALAPLKDEGVLIIGSGSAIHNVNSLHYLSNSNSSVESWAQEFDDWMTDALLDGRYEDVIDYEEKAPHARMAHPWPDHLYPLHVALGAAGENAKAKLIHGSFEMSTLSFSSYQFTSP